MSEFSTMNPGLSPLHHLYPFMRCGLTNNTESNNMLAWEATEHDDIHFPTSSGCFPFFGTVLDGSTVSLTRFEVQWSRAGHPVAIRIPSGMTFTWAPRFSGAGINDRERLQGDTRAHQDSIGYRCLWGWSFLSFVAPLWFATPTPGKCILWLFGSSANGRPELVGCLPSLPR